MKRYLTILFLSPLLVFGQEADVTFNSGITNIAFGSCSKQDQADQQLWKEVNQTNPDLWIWLGDNIYGDTSNMEVMKEKYDLQKSHPDYQQLMKQTDVIGIWDDHDYGVNDGGKEYAAKDGSKEQLFDFLDVAKNHPARKRKGAYQSYSYRGKEGNVKIILLDTRYFRDELNWENPGDWRVKIAKTNPEGDILGDAQWNWLAKQLSEDGIDLFLIGSGIQAIPMEHRWEKWSNFPKSRDRLFKAMASAGAPSVLLTGDRHISEVSMLSLGKYQAPIYEFTSSSLTTPAGIEKEENKYRIGEKIYDRNFTLMSITWANGKPILDVKYIGPNNTLLSSHKVAYE